MYKKVLIKEKLLKQKWLDIIRIISTKKKFKIEILKWWQLSDNRIGISFSILLNSNSYLASLELSLSANLYTHLVAYAFSILKNSALSSFPNFQLQCPPWANNDEKNNDKLV